MGVLCLVSWSFHGESNARETHRVGGVSFIVGLLSMYRGREEMLNLHFKPKLIWEIIPLSLWATLHSRDVTCAVVCPYTLNVLWRASCPSELPCQPLVAMCCERRACCRCAGAESDLPQSLCFFLWCSVHLYKYSAVVNPRMWYNTQ